MTSIRYVFRAKIWHPEHKRLARLRALYWIVCRRHETEICGVCGGPVALVWWCFDQALWNRLNGREGGTLCIRCFDDLAHADPETGWIEWAVGNLRHLDRPAPLSNPSEAGER